MIVNLTINLEMQKPFYLLVKIKTGETYLKTDYWKNFGNNSLYLM